MLYLDFPTKKLEIKLDSAATTNELEVSAHYFDHVPASTTTVRRGGEHRSTSSGTTDVTIVEAPTLQGTIRNVHTISIHNKDTVTQNVTVKLDNSGTETILIRQSVAAGETLAYEDGGGWTVLSPITPPFVDTTAIVKGSVDSSKLLRIEVDGITSATTRTWTVGDVDIKPAGHATGLTANRIPYASGSTGALLTDSANLRFVSDRTLTITGDIAMTVDNQFAFEMIRTGGDRLNVGPLAAGNGVQFSSYNSAISDFEPFNFAGENYAFSARTGVLTSRLVSKIDNSGLTMYNTAGDRWSTHGHDTNGPFWSQSNSGDQFEVRNASDTPIFKLINDGIATHQTVSSGQVMILNSNHASGPYLTFQRSGTSKFDIGTPAQLGGSSTDGMALGTRGTDAIEFWTNQGVAPARQLMVVHTSSAVNYLQVGGATAGAGPYVQVDGSDTNIDLRYFTKGTGAHRFYTDHGATEQVRINHTASANRQVVLTGSNGGNPVITTTAGDLQCNVPFRVFDGTPRVRVIDTNANETTILGIDNGSGGYVGTETNHDFFLMTGNVTKVYIPHVASAVNYFSMSAASTGNSPILRVSSGTDTNVNMILSSQGTGTIFFFTAGSSYGQFAVTHTANSVNYLAATGAITSNDPYIQATGSDSNVNLALRSKGSAGIRFYTNGEGSAAEQVRISHEASAVNYLQLKGAATGGVPSIEAAGSDANPGLAFIAKGSGRHSFYTNGGGSTAEQARISHTASAVNWVQLTGGATGNAALIRASSATDTDVALSLSGQGTGELAFYTSGFSFKQFNITHTASANRYISITGSNGGNPTISASGGNVAIGTPTLTLGADSSSQSKVEFLEDTDNGSNKITLQGPASVSADATVTLPDRTATLGINLQTTVAASGTAVDFTSIPAGVRRITLLLSNVSPDSNMTMALQIGDSGGLETSGYTGTLGGVISNAAGGTVGGGAGPSDQWYLVQFQSGTGNGTCRGRITLELQEESSNTWVFGALLSESPGSGAFATWLSAGEKSLSGTLDRVRLKSSNGVDAFDGGEVAISYEY